jgi:iron complex transport system permease protein
MRAKFLLVLIVIDILALITGLGMGSSDVGFKDIMAWVSGDAPPTIVAILKDIRLPRTLLALSVGASLATAGCSLQALFRNPLADPYILGISGGASSGAALMILLGIASTINIIFAAFLFAIFTAFIVYRLGMSDGKLPVYTILLAGVAMASFLTGITSLLIYIAGRDMYQVVFWIMGGFWTANWFKVKVVFVPMVLGILYMVYQSWNLNAILMGEEHAMSVGLSVEDFKRRIIIASALLTASAVSVSGVIGFVGLITPHEILLPSSILAGAAFMAFVDIPARMITEGEVPVGIITALLGAPFFLYLLRRGEY